VGAGRAVGAGGDTDEAPVIDGDAWGGGGGGDTGAVAGRTAVAPTDIVTVPVKGRAVAVRGDTNAVSATLVLSRRVVRKSVYAVTVAFRAPGATPVSEGPALHPTSTERTLTRAMSAGK